MASQAQTTEQTEFFCETPHGPVPVSRPHQVRFLQQTLDLAFKILSHETTVRISAQFLDKSGDSPTNNFDEEIHYYDPTAEPSRFVADVRVFLGEIFKTIIFETSVKLSDGTDGERRVEDPYKIFIRHSIILNGGLANELGSRHVSAHLCYAAICVVHETQHLLRRHIALYHPSVPLQTPAKVRAMDGHGRSFVKDGRRCRSGEAGWALEKSLFGGAIQQELMFEPACLFIGELSGLYIQRLDNEQPASCLDITRTTVQMLCKGELDGVTPLVSEAEWEEQAEGAQRRAADTHGLDKFSPAPRSGLRHCSVKM